ncbi:uncharacterized protein ARMOST_01575 [Armillaria ostoyae]|uniref:CCHC-type domain-containing protein n=1 Tax=Armillaria ostoyae TaxID=47428 RepID=A0A284QPH9_ARMOS|nr:uncharacterized protein ARMOST_01575 [Armillaria ostoyae]
MTPDLTTNQFIAIITAIVGACLIAFFTAIIVLTWREDILNYLYRHGLLLRPRRRQSPPPFPLHFILPRDTSNTTMDRPILEEQRLQSRAPYPPSSSDEFPQRTEAPPPRNATPGPSGTRHTPTPPSSPAPEEANNRDLRARYDSFPPPEYDPNDLPPPERALLPIRPRALMANPIAPAQRIFIRPPPSQFPPDESSDEDDGGFFGATTSTPSNSPHQTTTGMRAFSVSPHHVAQTTRSMRTASTTSGRSSRMSTETSSDQNDPSHGKYEETTSKYVTTSAPTTAPPWAFGLPPPTVTSYLALGGKPSSPLEFSRTETGQGTGPTRAPDYRDFTEEGPTRSRLPSKRPSKPLPDNWETDQTWKAADQNDFDNFYYDDYNPYAEELPAAPFPLPDSPNHESHLRPHHPRRLHGYHPPQYGTHPFAGGDNPDRQEGGSDQPIPDPAEEEKRQAAALAEQKLQEIADLEKRLNDVEMEHRDHATKWGLPLRPSDKGKNPERGRQPAHLPLPPNQYRPLWRRDDRYSVPRPPPDRGRPDPLPQPVGMADPTAPFMNVRPTMVAIPKAFVGDHEDIERFIGDCLMYFEAHASYFILPSHMIPFATSLFDGAAKTWWVHKRLEYWAGTGPAPHRFRYPTWENFINNVNDQFRDPAAMEVQEKKMFDLRMGNGPATTYFQELEVLATKAGRRHDIDPRGLMVKAVRLGVPLSYTTAITNTGRDIPGDYNEWKARIVLMYEERQKNWAFNQTAGNPRDNRPKGTSAITATSNSKAGGATSSPTPKTTAHAGDSRDSSGRWTTFAGAGKPMDIDTAKLRAEGKCFRCREKGHLSKDCPKKKEFRDIRRSEGGKSSSGLGSDSPSTAKDLLTGVLSAERSHGLFVGTSSNPTRILKCTNIFSTSRAFEYTSPSGPAFNVSSTTSKPAPESQNRYAALRVEECTDTDTDTPLKGCHDTSPARAQAKAVDPAGHEAESLPTRPLLTLGQTDAKRHTSNLRGETQPTNVLGGTSPTIVTPIDNASLPRMTDGTMSKSKDELYDKAAQVERPSTPKVDVESQLGGETTARLPGQERVPTPESTTPQKRPSPVGRPGKVMKVMTSQSPDAAGEVGQPRSLDATTPVVPTRPFDVRDDASVRTNPLLQRIVLVEVNQTNLRSPIAPGNVDEERPLNAAGVANATVTKKAEGQEAASAQAVNRGQSVTCIEVPDEDDDTAFQLWLTKERLPAITQTEATSDEPARSSTKPITFQKWYKPFEVDWTLRAVCEARNDNAARAALFVWTHTDRVPELTAKLLSELRKGGELARERLYELREPPRYLRRRQSNSRDFMLNVQLTTLTNRQVFATRGLVDSGCTSSAINRAFVQRHNLDTVKTAIPIIVYNADGSHNKGGDITEYVEVRLAIGDHEERIDLAVTDLGSKDLYLGHDWLKRHNPVINWETGTVIFGRCRCVKNPFPLPDADPDDRWDEELEDGDTILAVNMEEELVIRAVHHANDLAAAANAEKPTKTFEEMVPPDYRSFRDLFSKENFDELPERKPWDHAIELIPNAKSTLNCKVYPLNRNEQEQLDKFLDENLDSGRIKESKSPFASPFFFVKKKDGSLCPVQDYRKLNEMTIKN